MRCLTSQGPIIDDNRLYWHKANERASLKFHDLFSIGLSTFWKEQQGLGVPRHCLLLPRLDSL